MNCGINFRSLKIGDWREFNSYCIYIDLELTIMTYLEDGLFNFSRLFLIQIKIVF